MIVKFKKLQESATIPTQSHEGDAGIDFYAVEDFVIPAGGSVNARTGVAWEPVVDEGRRAYLQIQGRSGLSFLSHIEAGNAGVVDQNYRKEIRVKLYNTSNQDYIVETGDRIAQGIVHDLPIVTILEVTELQQTERKEGFGSTGK